MTAGDAALMHDLYVLLGLILGVVWVTLVVVVWAILDTRMHPGPRIGPDTPEDYVPERARPPDPRYPATRRW